jgi:hypothetical protein
LDGRSFHDHTIRSSFANSISDNTRTDTAVARATITCKAEKETAQLNEHDLSDAFSRYGDIRQLLPPQKPNQAIVKFYDLRAA